MLGEAIKLAALLAPKLLPQPLDAQTTQPNPYKSTSSAAPVYSTSACGQE